MSEPASAKEAVEKAKTGFRLHEISEQCVQRLNTFGFYQIVETCKQVDMDGDEHKAVKIRVQPHSGPQSVRICLFDRITGEYLTDSLES